MIIFHFLYRNTKSVGLNEWPIAIKWDEKKPPKRYGMYENLMTFKYEYPYHSFTTTIEENQALEKFIAASRSGDELRIRLFGSNTTSYDFSMANKDIKRLAQFLKIMP